MIRLVQILCFGIICMLVFTSYQQQVEVKALQKEIRTITHDMRVIGYAHDVAQAEWAYANGPERLLELLNTPEGEKLRLVPRTPAHYVDLAMIPLKAPLDFFLSDISDIPLLSLFAFPWVTWTPHEEGLPFSEDISPYMGMWAPFDSGQKYNAS